MGIDWNAIRERGEAGLLTADETDALVEIAQYADLDNIGWICPFCNRSPVYEWHTSKMYVEHADDCPLKVLESASDGDWKDRWELSAPGKEEDGD